MKKTLFDDGPGPTTEAEGFAFNSDYAKRFEVEFAKL